MKNMIYQKADVIRIGEEGIENRKRLWLIIAIVSFVFAVATFGILFFFKDKKVLILTISSSVIWIAFGLFSLIYRVKKQYDPLLFGCECIEREYNQKIRRKNRNARKAAVNKAKQTGRQYSYSVAKHHFVAKELYDLLQKDDMVEYYGYATTVRSKAVGRTINSKEEEPSTDEIGFYDMMDD